VQQGQTRQTATSPYLGDRVPQDNHPSSGGYGNPNQNLVGAGASGGNFPQRPPGVPPGVCWVCRQARCHSRFHEPARPPTPPPQQFRSPDICWTCGMQVLVSHRATPNYSTSSATHESKFGKRHGDSAFGQPRSDPASPKRLKLNETESALYQPTVPDIDETSVKVLDTEVYPVLTTFCAPIYE